LHTVNVSHNALLGWTLLILLHYGSGFAPLFVGLVEFSVRLSHVFVAVGRVFEHDVAELALVRSLAGVSVDVVGQPSSAGEALAARLADERHQVILSVFHDFVPLISSQIHLFAALVARHVSVLGSSMLVEKDGVIEGFGALVAFNVGGAVPFLHVFSHAAALFDHFAANVADFGRHFGRLGQMSEFVSREGFFSGKRFAAFVALEALHGTDVMSRFLVTS